MVAALRHKPVNLFSELLVHDMGPGLADGVSQGQAGPREFRSAPLWGLGQRIFLLHDGRTSDLVEAIQAHRSGSSFSGDASEANAVMKNFNDLLESQKQDMLNFLRSLWFLVLHENPRGRKSPRVFFRVEGNGAFRRFAILCALAPRRRKSLRVPSNHWRCWKPFHPDSGRRPWSQT